jgi:hypothetical protein
VSASATVVGPRSSQSRPALWLYAFSFPTAVAGLLLVLAVLTVQSRFDDPDMWWHLRTGQIIWATHSIPLADIFSYTTNHQASIPHEWLAQTLIYMAYRFGGYSGLMLWLCFFTAALYVAGYALCSLYSGNAKVGFLGAMVIWFFATSGLAVRPQMVGYFFLTIELLLTHLGRTRDPRWFFCLPPLFAVWVNCHGSFFVGFAVAGIFLFSSFFDFQMGGLVATRWSPRERQMLALALLLSAGALLLNPVGVRQVLYPLSTMLHQPLGLSQVEEWMPLVLSDPRGIGLLGLLGSIFLLAIVRRSELFWDELLLLAMGTWLAAAHRRMTFVFGILAAPILCRLLSTAWDGYDAKTDRRGANALLIAASLVVCFWAFPSRQLLTRQVEEGSPVGAVEFINLHHLSGRMLNDYVYGGYLIWAAPEHPVFVDGRSDVFEWTGVLTDFLKWATLQSNPKTLLDKYKIDFCLLAKQSPMARVLPLLGDWKSVYMDANSVIFVRD